VYPLGLPLFASPAGLMTAVALAGHPEVGPAKTLGAALPVLAAAAAAALAARERHQGLWRAAAQSIGALAVAVGVAFVVAGIRSV
jgi:small neutral amino acid transporter SnatA (MarC family)